MDKRRESRSKDERMPRLVLILYASVSGNAEALATHAADRLRAAGLDVELANVANFPVARLAEARTLLVLASTWGEGASPPEAEEFCATLGAGGAGRLPELRYAVLALGSRAYPDFCGCGRRIDEDLEKCGARRLLPRVDCDTKYKADFERWLAVLLTVLTDQ